MNIRGENWQADCPQCVASKFTCDKHFHEHSRAIMRKALEVMVYETTNLSPMEDDGSHWCKISRNALAQARAAIQRDTLS